MGKIFGELKKDFWETQVMWKATPYKHIPNLLTLLRILLTPFILYFLLIRDYYFAGILTVIALFTDALDGFLSKKVLHAKSEFGRKLDTIADKFLIMSVIISTIPNCPFILLPLLIGELIIAFLNIGSHYHGTWVKTLEWGRVKMILLSITVASTVCTYFISKLIWLTYFIGTFTILLQVICIIKYYHIFIGNKKVVSPISHSTYKL